MKGNFFDTNADIIDEAQGGMLNTFSLEHYCMI